MFIYVRISDEWILNEMYFMVYIVVYFVFLFRNFFLVGSVFESLIVLIEMIEKEFKIFEMRVVVNLIFIIYILYKGG